MKKILWALILVIGFSLALTGCRGDVADAKVVVKNATEYELQWLVFNIPQSSGTYSPMKNIITAEDESLKPDEEREVVISFVDTDFGNTGVALIGLEDDGSSDSLDDAKGGVTLERGTNRFKITYDGETFVITVADAMDNSNKSSENTAGGRGDLSIDRNQAEGIVKEATKAEALNIETKDGKPDYVYKGEGEIGGCKAWFFDLGSNYPGEYTVEHRLAVNEAGELWAMDTFGKWQLLPTE